MGSTRSDTYDIRWPSVENSGLEMQTTGSFAIAALSCLLQLAPATGLADKDATNVSDDVDDLVEELVEEIDEFFVNSEHATFTDDSTRVRVRLNSDYIQKHGWEFSPQLRLHLVLPGRNKRMRLVVNDDQGADVDQSSTNVDDEADAAVRWIGRQRSDGGYSFDLGLRFRNGDPDPFGRVNAGLEYEMPGKWVGQTTNRLFYYSKTGWRNDLRQYFNRAISDDLLLRSRTRIQYLEENVSNPFVEQKFSLFHSLTDTKKLAYEVFYRRVSEEGSPFDDDQVLGEPKNHYQHYVAQIRYRQQVWRPWFYVEFWPMVMWPEERDYDTILAGRIRLEVNIGGGGDSRLDE